MDPRTVAIFRTDRTAYPAAPPYDPGMRYPEYEAGGIDPRGNAAYEAVREVLLRAGLDRDRAGTADWNPLRTLIQPDQTVVLKPNLVKEWHPRDPAGWQYVLTHGSVIRAVADYVAKALRGTGRIIIADAPQTDSSFEKIVRVLGLDRLCEFYAQRGLEVELIDLRNEEWESRDGVVVSRRRLAGDPRGGIAYDLGSASELVGHQGAGRYYGADYDHAEVNQHHTGGRHEYMIAASVMQADVLFSLPKLKTHKKAGITVSLKNLVGINADKNWLPHHTEGRPSEGGDERPDFSGLDHAERRLVSVFRRLNRATPRVGPWLHRHARRFGRTIFGDTEEVIRSGNWWGNETIWRMCLDLNKIALYGNPDGTLRAAGSSNRRPHYVLVDGIVAGQGSGPMNPDPYPAGVTVFGVHPASVDAACGYLMGFDPDRIPIVRQAFRCRAYPLAEWDWRDVVLTSNVPAWNGRIDEVDPDATMSFEPHFGWKGSIERRQPA